MGWFFNRARRPDVLLMEALLKQETERLKQQAELDASRRAIEMRRMELEFENLERLGSEKRKDAEDRERLREQRRKWAASAREIKRQKLAAGAGAGANGCRVCTNPSDPSLTSAEITWHYNGHALGVAQ